MIKRILLTLTIIYSINIQGQNNLVYSPVLLTIDKENGQYAAKEQVNVYAELIEEVNDSLVCLVKADGKVIQEAIHVSLQKGEKKLIYSAAFDKPTAGQCFVFPHKNKKEKAAVGFVVDAENIRPGFEDPENFEKFWARQLRVMRKCKMKYALVNTDFPSSVGGFKDQYELYAMEVNMHEGRPVHAYISWPKNAEPSSLPILIYLHGAGYSRSNAANAVEWAAKANGVIAIDINAHGYPDDQPQEYYDSLANGELKDYRRRKVTDHKSFYFRLMYLRAVRALDFATTLPLWDGKRIMSMGASQGGAQAIAVSAIDKRVGAVCSHVPALTDLAGHLQNHRGGWPSYDKQMLKKDNLENEMSVLPYYDGAMMLQHIDAKIWIEAGLIDSVCPPECVIAAFNSAVSSDKTLYTFPYRPHSSSKIDNRVKSLWDKMIYAPRFEEIIDWLK